MGAFPKRLRPTLARFRIARFAQKKVDKKKLIIINYIINPRKKAVFARGPKKTRGELISRRTVPAYFKHYGGLGGHFTLTAKRAARRSAVRSDASHTDTV